MGSGALMERCEAHFNDRFQHWDVRLPPDDIARRTRGKIVKAGWAIWYLFGSDADGEYLDYYAAHRMTSDDHCRVYDSGKCVALPVIQEMRRASDNPAEDARLSTEFYRENQRVAEMLRAKGFNLRGDEPGGVQMNRILHLNNLDERSE